MKKVRIWVLKILLVNAVLLSVIAIFNLGGYFLEADQMVKVSISKSYVSGQDGSFEIKVANDEKIEPLESNVKVMLLQKNNQKVKELFKGVTDDLGSLYQTVKFPEVEAGEYKLEFIVSSKNGTDEIAKNITVSKISGKSNVVITLDKPAYKPGDLLKYGVMLLDPQNDKPQETKAKVSIFDGNDNRVYYKDLTASEFGIIVDDFNIAKEVNNGRYKIKIETGLTSNEKFFDVKPYVLPKYNITLETDKSEYVPGDKLELSINAKYFFGKPVHNAKFSIKVNGKTYENINSDKDGSGSFSYKLDKIGNYDLTVSAIDESNNYAESSKMITVNKGKFNIDILSESSQLIKGIQNELYIFTYKNDGSPLRTNVYFTGDINKEIVTNNAGMAKIKIVPNKSKKSISINAYVRDENENLVQQDFNFKVTDDNAMTIRSVKALFEINEPVNIELISNVDFKGTVLYFMKNNEIIKIVKTEKDLMDIELPKDTYGLVDIFAINRKIYEKNFSKYFYNRNSALASKSIFIRPNKGLDINIEKSKLEYKPGENLKVKFDVKSKTGDNINSNLLVSVINKSLLGLGDYNLTLDNLKLAIEGKGLNEKINNVDLYSAVINSASDLTISALLSKRSANLSIYDSVTIANNSKNKNEKMENSKVFFFWAIMILIIFGLLKIKKNKTFMIELLVNSILVSVIFILLRFLINIIDIRIGVETTFIVAFIFVFIGNGFFRIFNLPVIVNKDGEEIKQIEKTINYFRSGFSGYIIMLALVFVTSAIMMYVVFLGMHLNDRDLSVPESNNGQNEWRGAERLIGGGSGADVMDSLSDKFSFSEFFDSGTSEKSSDTEQGNSEEFEVYKGVYDKFTSKNTESSEIKRVRKRFLESMYFNPGIFAKDGKVSLEFPVADNITNWNMQVVGNTKNGDIGSKNDIIKVFQDFFVDFTFPKNLTVNDQISVPLTLYNYQNVTEEVSIEVTEEDWFTLNGDFDNKISIDKGETKLIYIPIKVNRFGEFDFRISCLGKNMGDAVEKKVNVNPAGFKIQQVSVISTVDKEADETIAFFEKDIKEARTLKIKIFSDTKHELVEGLDSMLRFPSGCFEQTSSILYPNILILDYLKRNEQDNPEIKTKALSYIETGFQKILTYEVASERGGFSLYGKGPANVVLTALGLMEISDLQEVYSVDEKLIERVTEYLFNKQKFDGSFDLGNQYGRSALSSNAYIAWAISESVPDDERIKKTVEYLKEESMNTDDNYTLALIANVLVNTKNIDSQKLLDRLINNVTSTDDLDYLKTSSKDHYGTCGKTQDLQATALMSIALSKESYSKKTNEKFIRFIKEQKDEFGTFGTTKATVLSLKALVENKKSKNTMEKTNIVIDVNGEKEEIVIGENVGIDLLERTYTNLKDENQVKIQTTSEIDYEIIKEYYVPYEEAKTSKVFEVTRSIQPKVKVNELTKITIKAVNHADVDTKNLMIVAKIPQGFVVEENSLQRLLDVDKIEKFDYSYENINFYIKDFNSYEKVEFSYMLRPTFPGRILTGEVHVYDYYNPFNETKVLPTTVEIIE